MNELADRLDKGPLVLGLLLLVGAVLMVNAVLSSEDTVEDPWEEQVWNGTIAADAEMTVHLDKGSYSVWCEKDDSPGEVVIEDEDGKLVFSDQKGDFSDLTLGNQTRVGLMEIEKGGNFTIQVEDTATIVIAAGSASDTTFFSVCIFVFLVLGVVGLLLGIGVLELPSPFHDRSAPDRTPPVDPDLLDDEDDDEEGP